MTTLLVLPIVLPLLAAALCILTGSSRAAQRAIGLTTLTALVPISIAILVRVDDDGQHRRPGRRLAGADRHHADRRPPVGDHVGHREHRAAGGARVRHRPARRRAQPRRVPVDVHDPRRRRGGVVPHRRPVHAVRRHRDDADRELRPVDARRSPGAGARRHDLRRHQPHRLDAVPRRRWPSPTRPPGRSTWPTSAIGSRRCRAACAPPSPACCSSCSASRRRSPRCTSGCRTAYPTAPSAVTAIFAGLLTKVGIYAIIRTQTCCSRPTPASARSCSSPPAPRW